MEAQPQPQSSGSGGRTGGPPLVACGYCGDDDEKPRKNARARREKRGPATKERSGPLARIRIYLKDVVREADLLHWPRSHKFVETLVCVLLGFFLLFVAAKQFF